MSNSGCSIDGCDGDEDDVCSGAYVGNAEGNRSVFQARVAGGEDFGEGFLLVVVSDWRGRLTGKTVPVVIW